MRWPVCTRKTEISSRKSGSNRSACATSHGRNFSALAVTAFLRPATEAGAFCKNMVGKDLKDFRVNTGLTRRAMSVMSPAKGFAP